MSTGQPRAARPHRGAATGGLRLCGQNRTGPHGAGDDREGSGPLTWKEPEASGCAGADIPGGTHRSPGDPGGAAPHRTAALRGEGPRRRHCRAPHHTGPPGRPGRPRPRLPAPAPIPVAAGPRPRSWAAAGRHRERTLPTTRSAAASGRAVPGKRSPPEAAAALPTRVQGCGSRSLSARIPRGRLPQSPCPFHSYFATPTPGHHPLTRGHAPKDPRVGRVGPWGDAAHPPHAPCPRRAHGAGRFRCCCITGPAG